MQDKYAYMLPVVYVGVTKVRVTVFQVHLLVIVTSKTTGCVSDISSLARILDDKSLLLKLMCIYLKVIIYFKLDFLLNKYC